MTPASGASRRPRLRKGEGRQLRAEILEATERLLLESGSVDAVSIRAVADAVGVTPPSIYRHFADKNALIFDVSAMHFTALENRLREAVSAVDDPIERLVALGHAYIEFGVANPEPYRIMFMTQHEHVPKEYHGEVLAKSASFDLLIGCVEDALAAGRIRDDAGDAYELSLGLWARVHGLVSLWVSMPDMPWAADAGFVERYAEVCLGGIVARPSDALGVEPTA